MEVHRDAHVYDNGMITVIEIMGRHAAGWPVPLDWLPGRATDRISSTCPRWTLTWISSSRTSATSTTAPASAWWRCLRASTTLTGTFVSEAKTSATDGFGHAQLGGLATMLAEVVKKQTRRQGAGH